MSSFQTFPTSGVRTRRHGWLQTVTPVALALTLSACRARPTDAVAPGPPATTQPAATQLAATRPAAIGPLAEALRDLTDDDADTRQRAARRLAAVVTVAEIEIAWRPLIAATVDPDARVRLAAVESVKMLSGSVFGARLAELSAAVLGAAADPDPSVHDAAVAGLDAAPDPVRAALARLASSEIAAGLARRGTPPNPAATRPAAGATLANVLSNLADDAIDVRRQAAVRLGGLAATAEIEAAWRPLVAATVDPDARVRLAAVESLKQIQRHVNGGRSADFAAAIVGAAADPNTVVRAAAVEGLIATPDPERAEAARMASQDIAAELDRGRVSAARAAVAAAVATQPADAGPGAVVARLAAVVANHDEKLDARIAACDALRAGGPGSAAAVPVLVEALRDYATLAERAKAALIAIGPAAVAALVDAGKAGGLTTSNKADVTSVLRAAGNAEAVRAQVPRLLAALKEAGGDPNRRDNLAETFAAIGPISGELGDAVFEALAQLLRDPGHSVRLDALAAMREVRPRDAGLDVAEAVTQLQATYQFKLIAAQKLADVPPEAIRPDRFGVLPTLTAALGDAAVDVRAASAVALVHFGPAAVSDTAVVMMATALRMPVQENVEPRADAAARDRMAEALLHLGPDARAASAVFIAMLADPGAAPPHLAGSALRRIGPDAVPALIEATRDKRPAARVAAMDVLADVYPFGEPAAAALSACLRDEQPAVRRAAADALGRTAPTAAAARAALAKAVSDPNPQVRATAVESLAALCHAGVLPAPEPASAPDMKALAEVLGGEDNAQRTYAAAIARRYGPAAADTAPALSRMAGNRRPDLRRAAAAALAAVDPDGRRSAPAVLAAVKSGDAEAAGLLAPSAGRAPDAAALTGRLQGLARDDADPAVRAAAGAALGGP